MKKQSAVSSCLRLKQRGGRNEKQSGFPINANRRVFRGKEINGIIKRPVILLKMN
jgi:hypothetical protein